jgi:hypothetical protein
VWHSDNNFGWLQRGLTSFWDEIDGAWLPDAPVTWPVGWSTESGRLAESGIPIRERQRRENKMAAATSAAT